MPRATLEDYDNKFVPLSMCNYGVMLSDYPDLGPLAAQVEIPERSTERVRVELMGKSRVFPGRRISSSNELNITFVVDRKTQTYQQLLALQDSFSENKTGNIVGRLFDIKVINYDDIGIEAMAFSFTECWLAQVGSLQYDSTSESQIATCACVFCYTEMGYHFTRMASLGDQIISVLSRITGQPIQVDNTDRYGSFNGFEISKPLVGSNPVDVVQEKRSKLSEFVGLTIEDIASMRDIIESTRNILTSAQSRLGNLSALGRAAVRGDDIFSIASKVKSISGIKSLF